METKANYVLIGAFTLAGFAGLMGFLLWFAKIEMDRQFDYYDVFFPEVSGLGISSEVRFAGLPVGQVVDMGLAPSGDGTVKVRLEVREGTPVRINSRASVDAQGVTGVANVGITSGTPTAPLLSEGATGVPVIQSSRSVLQTLGDQGPEMIERLNTVAEQLTTLLGEDNQQRVVNILNNVERSSGNLDQAIADISAATGSIASAAENIAAFGDDMGGLSEAATTTMANADTALQKFTETAGKADDALAAGTGALDSVRGYIDGDLKKLTQRLDATATKAEAFADRAGSTLDVLDSALESGTRTLASAERAFDGADKVINTDIGPVMSDLRASLGNFNEAVNKMTDDLPAITGPMKSAANSADAAFASLRSMLDGARGPVQNFTRDGLGQFSNLGRDLRGLTENLNQLVTNLRRNPSQIISGPKTPEFRR